jgi:hypothetical protein
VVAPQAAATACAAAQSRNSDQVARRARARRLASALSGRATTLTACGRQPRAVDVSARRWRREDSVAPRGTAAVVQAHTTATHAHSSPSPLPRAPRTHSNISSANDGMPSFVREGARRRLHASWRATFRVCACVCLWCRRR